MFEPRAVVESHASLCSPIEQDTFEDIEEMGNDASKDGKGGNGKQQQGQQQQGQRQQGQQQQQQQQQQHGHQQQQQQRGLSSPAPQGSDPSSPNLATVASMQTAPPPQREPPACLEASVIATTALNWTKQPIGHGGFSNVYEGKYFQQDVAVKVLTIRDQSERDMFDEELKALLNPALWHDNICPLVAYCHTNPAFLFPRLKPLSMDRLVRLPLDVRTVVAADVARGLGHMHAAGWVHSDMKPDNVLLEFNEHRVIVRAMVGDMGCVKSCSIPVKPFGTILFLDPGLNTQAPQLPKPADDVFSLGITLLAIFGSVMPETVHNIWPLKQKLSHEMPFHGNLVERMTQQDPQMRPTCQAVAAELLAHVSNPYPMQQQQQQQQPMQQQQQQQQQPYGGQQGQPQHLPPQQGQFATQGQFQPQAQQPQPQQQQQQQQQPPLNQIGRQQTL
jgi:serine/threonine protein kinase